MRHFLFLLFALLLTTACDTARFDSGGTSEKSANGFEVVTEEEENAVVDDQDGTDEGVIEDDDDSDDDSDDNDCEGDDCDNDDGDDDDDGEEPPKDCKGKKCVISPDTVFDDDDIKGDHACGEELQEHKVNICKWPNGDQSKELTLCVAKASLEGQVKKRRQDVYYLGICSEIGDEPISSEGSDQE